MKIMKNDGRLRRIAGATLMAGLCAAALLVSCSQDELFSAGEDAAGDALPEGMYPLQIGSISVSAEGSGQPWTRVAETADGSGCVFTNGDVIGVSLNGNTTTYTYDGSTWTSTNPLYWKDTNKATVTAWYPTTAEIDFTQQDRGLTYLLKATTDQASYNTAANLTFTHQLAKVRVVLTGVNASKVADVKIRSYPTATNTQGTQSGNGSSPAYYPMRKATYGSTTCWEANMIPGKLIANNSFQISKSGGTPVTVRLDNDVPIKAGNMHTITITVNSIVPDNAQTITGNISDNGTYVVRGTRTSSINITGGKPTIYLDDATVSVTSGNAINITGNASPTIHVVGENTIKTKIGATNRAAGIYVAGSSSVTIKGNGTGDVLRVTGGCDGAAIGGYSTNNCGDITISNVTVYATVANDYAVSYAPGIGSTGSTCGTITITSAIVRAYGLGDSSFSAPAIGAYGSVPKIVITGSEIYAYRGSYAGTSYADYIGRGGSLYDYQGGAIQCGTGSITNTTVYKGAYSLVTFSSSDESSVVYNASGTGTVQ